MSNLAFEVNYQIVKKPLSAFHVALAAADAKVLVITGHILPFNQQVGWLTRL